ncbi:MAG TPA: fatty acid cis/trans isomerase, partial [Pseudomonadales bacterium]|nr:fatty acid cis/trans isomerase [Pseudomonadales bacterium]
MNSSRLSTVLALFLLSFVLMSCSPSQNITNVPALQEIPLIPQKIELPAPSPDILSKRHPLVTADSKKNDTTQIDYQSEIKPILDGRCVVCHSCYDAPCQLKLTAPEGIERGATKRKLYDGERLFAAEPTRLFVDAFTVNDWRKKEFFPVLDEQTGSRDAALNASLLYQFIRLKQEYPQPNDTVLPASFKLESYRDLECPSSEEMPDFKKNHPLWGMPYGLPGLTDNEFQTLTRWLQQGAVFNQEKPLSASIKQQVQQWETFFNKNDLKSQLISRYIFEHLAFAHIYFSDVDNQTFFTLQRSSTPPGLPIKPIVTLRPYDEPKVSRVYYRLQNVKETIVDKSHLAYALNDQKQQRWKELFWSPAYAVTKLPNYSTQTAANPFVTFAAIPARARYQFMLDDAYFFISSFIKGPVCWGPIALNVINDRFFVSFTDPSHDPVNYDDGFIKNASHMLSLPAEMEDHFNLTAAWTLYAKQQKKYLKEKQALLKQHKQTHTLAMIWPGNGQDGDGTMTIFRHYDNASVLKGFIGNTPKTAWVIDYPIFERIYYLLVAGFNEYGNVGHQLSTRLYMDFLRMESEGNFIDFLPDDQKLAEHQRWYPDISPRLEQFLFDKTGLKIPSSTDKQSARNAKKSLLLDIAKFTQTTGQAYNIAPYWTMKKIQPDNTLAKILWPLTQLQGEKLQLLPDLSYLRVKFKNPEQDAVYSIINNKAHRSVDFIFGEDLRRLPKNDSLTLVRTLTGSYPNYIYTVPFEKLADF